MGSDRYVFFSHEGSGKLCDLDNEYDYLECGSLSVQLTFHLSEGDLGKSKVSLYSFLF